MHLFLLPLWIEPLTNNRGKVRMQVKHLLGSKTRYFRTWPDVVVFLPAKLHGFEAERRQGEGDGP